MEKLMQFTAVRTLPELEALSEEWNALLEESASHVPFLRHEYLLNWWKTLGGGEWESGDLFVTAARDETGKLAGIAPLFFTRNREGQAALMLLGSIEISDYLDVIAPEDSLPGFIPGLVEFLVSGEGPQWQVLDLYNLVEDSPSLPLLEAEAQKRGLGFRVEQLQHCPYIPLPETWDEYLSGIDKKQRHEIRRKIRRAQAWNPPVELVWSGENGNLDADMEAFFNLMAQDPEKDKFLTEEMRRQMKVTAHAAAESGYLQLAFIEVGGEKAAVYMNFDYLNRIWVYNSGLDQRFRELSLGWVLLGYLIQWSIENGREAFDFMRGDEEYKYRFGGIDRRVVRAILSRENGTHPA